MTDKTTDKPIVQHCQQNDSGCVLTLLLPENLVYFEGHFPEQPILAGVVQLDWAISFARQYLTIGTNNDAWDVTSVEILKFQQIIEPNATVELSLEQKSADKFVFAYSSSAGNHASGRIKVGVQK